VGGNRIEKGVTTTFLGTQLVTNPEKGIRLAREGKAWKQTFRDCREKAAAKRCQTVRHEVALRSSLGDDSGLKQVSMLVPAPMGGLVTDRCIARGNTQGGTEPYGEARPGEDRRDERK
jgi:hypothetical protein